MTQTLTARRSLLLGIAAGLGLAFAQPALADAQRQALVNDATSAAQALVEGPDFPDIKRLLPRARAVLIVPAMVQGGFIVGAAGGRGVMLARQGNGQWSHPAFYGMGAGSVGLQIGGKVSEVMLIVLTERGLNALLEDRFKFGAEAGITMVSVAACLPAAPSRART